MKKSLIKATFALVVSAMVCTSCEKENFESNEEKAPLAIEAPPKTTTQGLAAKSGDNPLLGQGGLSIRYDGPSRRDRDAVLAAEDRFGIPVKYFSLPKCSGFRDGNGRRVPNRTNVILYYTYDYVSNGQKRYGLRTGLLDTRIYSNFICRVEGDD